MNELLRRARVIAGLEPDRAPRRTTTGGPKHASRLPFALLVVGLVVGGLVLLLGLNTASAANELRRQSMADRDEGMSASVEQLSNDIAASAAPGNLARAAAALGMVPAQAPAFVVVDGTASPTLLGKPGAATAAPLAAPAGPHHHAHHPTPSTSAPATTPHATPHATAGATSHATRRPSGHGASTSAAKRSHRTHTPTRPPAPRKTPTPTVTLPGGNR